VIIGPTITVRITQPGAACPWGSISRMIAV
jgi:hypothetical protein